MPDQGAEGPLKAIGKMIEDLTVFMWDAFTALNVNGITGDYAEFGSAGATSIGAAHAVIRHSPIPRHLWAFDSFAGLPETTDALDQHPAFIPGVGQGGVNVFHARCATKGIPRDAYTTVEGYFADTMPPLGADGPPADIALAYVDCNLYSSTVTTLEFLRPWLKHGMIVAFDDYFCWTASGVSGERMALHEFLRANPEWHFERYKDPTWGAVSYVVERADVLSVR